ncbi:hypothetical protein BJV82DRAFT_187897 [Fennellomyces sp. T-0311]|nr:hypothetical protein BJV82DRAFT_187897 [Fennellomyces sp. T-0311]
MPRKTPCRACKKRQRGCFYHQNSSVCVRCTKLKLTCIPIDNLPDDDDDVLPKEYIPKTLEYWRYQVTQLDQEMKYLERNVRECSTMAKQGQWQLSVEDGKLKLQTAIKSIEEMIMYSRASLRYISPFKGLFNNVPIRCENATFTPILRAFRKMFTRVINEPDRPRLAEEQLQTTSEHYRTIIDHIIHVYFQYKNPRLPFLHAPTFFEHYRNLADPLSCPVTLAVCVNTVCTSRRHLDYSADERRHLAEFFYTKCKAILVDIFDAPSRKLETIFSVTFLHHYVTFILLQPSEARRLVTIAYLLCRELDSQADDNDVPAMRILIHRHSMFAENALSVLSFLMDERPSPYSLLCARLMETIPGEDDATCQNIDMYNHLLPFVTNPQLRAAMDPMDHMISGGSDHVTLEAVFRLDLMVHEWWKGLPNHLRVCDDLFAENATSSIQQNTSIHKAIVFSCAHATLLRLYACLITPERFPQDGDSPTGDDESNHEELVMLLNERAKNVIMRSSDALLSTILHIHHTQADMPPPMLEFLSRAIYGLFTVSLCPTVQIPLSIQQKFNQAMHAMSLQFPADNQIAPSSSPLDAFMITQQISNFDVYRSRPLPGYALVSDILCTTHTYLQSHFVRGPDGSWSWSSFLGVFANALMRGSLIL